MSLYRLVSRADRQVHVVRSQAAPARVQPSPLVAATPISAGRSTDAVAQTTSGSVDLLPPGYSPPGTLPPPGGSGYY